MNDLFSRKGSDGYSAKDIEVLEGLEPVRRRPGMYIGGTDETALHHLAAELLDNAMDEAVAGHASFIEVTLEPDNWLTVRDNGRGIPVDPHPKFKNLSALEVILTTLHSGGKFAGKVYATSGGLHGVGSSVVNALVREAGGGGRARPRAVEAELRARQADDQAGQCRPGAQPARHLDPLQAGSYSIWTAVGFIPARLYRLCRSKAYLFRGVQIRWACDASLLQGGKDDTPAEAVLHFPGGLRDSLEADIGETPRVLPQIWAGEADLPSGSGRRGMGGRLAGGRRGVRALLLQHHSHHAGRHPRGRVPRRAAEGPARLGRAARQPSRRAGRARGPARPDGGQAVGVPARAAVPGPDQGEADQHRGDAPGGDRAARPLRPLAGRRSRRRPTTCWPSSSSAPRSGCAAARTRTPRASPRPAGCACPAS